MVLSKDELEKAISGAIEDKTVFTIAPVGSSEGREWTLIKSHETEAAIQLEMKSGLEQRIFYYSKATGRIMINVTFDFVDVIKVK